MPNPCDLLQMLEQAKNTAYENLEVKLQENAGLQSELSQVKAEAKNEAKVRRARRLCHVWLLPVTCGTCNVCFDLLEQGYEVSQD